MGISGSAQRRALETETVTGRSTPAKVFRYAMEGQGKARGSNVAEAGRRSDPPRRRHPPDATVSGEPTVFVVDDDAAMRDSLRWLVESVRLRVETYETAAEFLRSYDASMPGCLVLDVRMPGLSGLDLQDELAARQVHLPVIMVTAYAEVPMAVRALRAGAVDFLEKPFSDQDLLDRIRQSIETDRQRRARDAERARLAEDLAELTPREEQVRTRITQGISNKAIAAELGLSSKTIEAHRKKVMQKLGAESLAELIRRTLPVEGDKGTP